MSTRKKPTSTRKKKINAPKSQNVFLEALSTGATVADAAKAANVSPATVYRWRKADEEFANDWGYAYEMGADSLEAEAQRRAVEGIEAPVYFQGKVCGAVRNYSDTLLMFLLKSRAPLKYCDRARTAQIARTWSKEDGSNDGDAAFASAGAIAALERLASDKSATARRPNI